MMKVPQPRAMVRCRRLVLQLRKVPLVGGAAIGNGLTLHSTEVLELWSARIFEIAGVTSLVAAGENAGPVQIGWHTCCLVLANQFLILFDLPMLECDWFREWKERKSLELLLQIGHFRHCARVPSLHEMSGALIIDYKEWSSLYFFILSHNKFAIF